MITRRMTWLLAIFLCLALAVGCAPHVQSPEVTEAERALADAEKTFGPGHPHVAKSLNDLALLYETQGRYAEAEPLFQRAIAINEMALGLEHPEVATSLENYALLLSSMGRDAEVVIFKARANAISAKHARDNLELRDVKAVRRVIDGEWVVVIKGQVVNVSGEERQVPLLRASVTNAEGEELDRWTFQAESASLASGATTRFETVAKNPPRKGDLHIDFVFEE